MQQRVSNATENNGATGFMEQNPTPLVFGSNEGFIESPWCRATVMLSLLLELMSFQRADPMAPLLTVTLDFKGARFMPYHEREQVWTYRPLFT